MQILNLQVMRGPNVWSNYRSKIIIMKLDIQELEQYPSNKIDGFCDRLKTLIPSLATHRCSYDFEGGFFKRLDDGTWMGHIIEHIALEIQTLAGMEAGYGRTRSTGEEGIYNVVFSYEVEKAGVYAAKAAVRIAEALVKNEPYNLQEDIEELQYLNRTYNFGPSTGSIVAEAQKRNIPFKRLDEDSMVVFGHGIHQKRIRATMTSGTSSMGVDIAGDKDDTKKILMRAHIPMAEGDTAYDEEGLNKIIDKIGYPIVIKPIDGNHGRGVTTNIRNMEDALIAFHFAKKVSRKVIVERFMEGFDYRFLVINHKLVAVAKRTPAAVVGDGVSTIQQLIDETNLDPNRGEGHEKVMTTIKVDEITQGILSSKNLTLDSVLIDGQTLYLKDTANISTGGTSADVTDMVHPYNVLMAERISRIVGLDVCGIDIIAQNINIPIKGDVGGVVEVNACPGFRMHLAPSNGMARNVAKPVMDMLFPENAVSRVPIIAVTGTNGKTTTTRLLAHMAKQAGHKVGFTTTDGIYIQDHQVYSGDCTGPISAETVLTDPTVDFAVLECARGGILRSGLGFDNCNISIITNISDDHLGLKGINTLQEMAAVKEVVARSTYDDGFCILNADDDLVYAMKDKLYCNIALFSTDPENRRILPHIESGGLAAVVENGILTIYVGDERLQIARINDVPLSLGGKAECMVKNILAATLAAVIQRFTLEDIRKALGSFIPSPELTPGRFNMFKFPNFEVMIDYAHNVGGFVHLEKFLSQTQASDKIGIIAATGDRRDEDIRNVGIYAAKMFNIVIVRLDKDLRGSTPERINSLVLEGIESVDKTVDVIFIPEEERAIEFALSIAPEDSFVTILSDCIDECIVQVSAAQKSEFEKLTVEDNTNDLLMSQAS